MLLAQSGLALIGPRLTEHALDVAIPGKDVGLLGLLTALYAGTLVFDFIVEYAGALLTTFIGQRVMYDLRMEMFAHLQRLSVGLLRPQPGGPADDPGHQRRRDAERALLLGSRHRSSATPSPSSPSWG